MQPPRSPEKAREKPADFVLKANEVIIIGRTQVTFRGSLMNFSKWSSRQEGLCFEIENRGKEILLGKVLRVGLRRFQVEFIPPREGEKEGRVELRETDLSRLISRFREKIQDALKNPFAGAPF